VARRGQASSSCGLQLRGGESAPAPTRVQRGCHQARAGRSRRGGRVAPLGQRLALPFQLFAFTGFTSLAKASASEGEVCYESHTAST
jgi:hypothetical protein